jgi:outer membrane protein
MKRSGFFLILFVTALLVPAAVSSAAPLTLQECIRTAILNHPDLAAAESRVESSRTTIDQAAASGRPQVSASSAYTRNDNTSQSNSTSQYNTGLTVSQSISDWGRRKLNVKKAQQTTEATSGDFLEARDQVINDVRSAYYSLNSALRQNIVAKSRYNNYVKRLKWSKTYYQVGTKAKIEVTKAEADLANSKLTLVKTESAIAQARAALASAMGEPKSNIGEVEDVLGFKDWDITEEEAISRAIANRPELAAKQKRIEAAKTNLAYQMKGLSPSLSVSGGYSFYGSSPVEDNGWNAKVSLSAPLVDGGLTKSQVAQAQADLKTAQAEFASLSNSVVLEVRKAWQSMREARQSLSTSKEAERSQKANYELAEGRYQAGVGNSLEISDAVENYATAQTNTVLALYNSKSSQLALEKAIGGLAE